MSEPLTPGAAGEEPVTPPAQVGASQWPDSAPPSLFGPPNAGGMIRAARQEQGMDLASLAAMLKIPLRRLEALENGRHDELQGPTFERALAQAACRVLKIDPKPVLAFLPQNERNTLERVSDGLNTPFRERQGGVAFGEATSLLRPVVIVPALIVVAALLLFYFPEALWTRLTHPFVAGQPAARTAAEPGEPAASGAATSSAEIVLDPVTAASAPAAIAAAPVAEAAGSAALVPPPKAAVASTGASAPLPVPAPPGVDEVLAHVASPNIPLQVTASAQSWVEVVDAQGRTLLSRTVLAGETVGLDGALPMRVKIGNAGATRVLLRGDNVDLAPWTRDNVARVELK